jgi:hypothetical protein
MEYQRTTHGVFNLHLYLEKLKITVGVSLNLYLEKLKITDGVHKK